MMWWDSGEHMIKGPTSSGVWLHCVEQGEHLGEPPWLPQASSLSVSFTPSCWLLLSLGIPQLYLVAPFHPFLGLSGSFLFLSSCCISSAQVPQRGRAGGSSGGCLALEGGGTARGQVWAGLSGKLQQHGQGESGLHQVMV